MRMTISEGASRNCRIADYVLRLCNASCNLCSRDQQRTAEESASRKHRIASANELFVVGAQAIYADVEAL